MLPKRTTSLLLLLVLIGGFCLRIITITWGLPNEMRQHSYHGDEATNLVMFSNFEPKSLSFDPHYYVSGTLGYYLLAGAIFTGKILGFYPLAADPAFYKRNVSALRKIYLVQRLLIVLHRETVAGSSWSRTRMWN